MELVELEELEIELGEGLCVGGLSALWSIVGQTVQLALGREPGWVGLLEAGEDGGAHAGLEEEDQHQGEGVGGESIVAGIIDFT